MLFLKMVVAPLVHLDDHDVDLDANVDPYLLIELVVPCLLIELVVVDNVVQLVVVLLDVDVELIALNRCRPFLLLYLGDAHSGCCTLLMPIPDVAPPEFEGT